MPRKAIILGQLYGRLELDSKESGHALAEWTSLPFDEAIAFFRAKRLMPPDAFKALDDSARREAFTVAGLYEQHALERAHEVLSDALEQGTPQRQALKQLREVMDRAGLVGDSKWHRENVFRTNVIGAYAEGRWQQARKVRKSRPYWRYVTVGDNRVRPAHAAMNGHVAPADDPIWETWTPPCGWACRCSLETISQTEFEDEGLELKPPPDVRPDPGWAGSPAQNERARKALKRLEREASRMDVLRPPMPATSGTRAYRSPGDLGWSTSKRRADLIDRLAGVTSVEAKDLVAKGPINIIAGTEKRLPASTARFQLTMPSQHLDGLEQIVERLARDPRTSSIVDRISYRPVARFIPGEAPRRFSAAVVRDGFTRASAIQLQIETSDATQAEAIAELLMGAEKGSGQAVRNASESADLVISGVRSDPPDFKRVRRATEIISGRTRARLIPEIVDSNAEGAVLITRRRYDAITQ